MLNTLKKLNKPLYLIGQGYTNSFCPIFIKNHFLRNPHIYSPYTPYQSEISQGRLELLYSYQEMIKNINNMDIASASMLDSGQIVMDLISLMKNHNKRNIIYYQDSINQTLKNCMNTRAVHQNIELRSFNNKIQLLQSLNNNKISGIIFQNPTNIGDTQDLSWIKEIKKIDNQIVLACNTDLMYSVLHVPAGDYDFDFSFGNSSNFGIGLNFGGPQPSFLAAKNTFIRQIPGKLIGKTVDINNRDCYRLALQTREQFIKRDKATSNICTNQSLLATMSVAWGIYHGNDGLKTIATNILDKTTAFKNNLNSCNIDTLNYSHFNSITIKNSKKLENVLLNNNIYSYINKDYMSFSFDETINMQQIDYLSEIVTNPVNYSDVIPHQKKSTIYLPPKSEFRKDNPLKYDMLTNKYSEQDMLRYLHHLGTKDFSLMNGMIPLGSCTMKHTPVDSMDKILNEDMNIHPYVPIEDTPYKRVYDNISDKLCKLTGFSKVFYQSQSGAMGEYAGLTTIRNYHNDDTKEYILMPKSAHGTNASSTTLAGYKIINLEETIDGMIDIDLFNTAVEKYGNKIAGLMITYPSTYGLYEENIQEIIDKIHSVSGLVYLDGANMNALIGRNPLVANFGFDLCHFNLHKTFAIPHGGGGPGMGPIAVTSKLEKFLPKFSINEESKSISTVPYGSGLIVQISEDYISKLFETDLEVFHKNLINRINYIISILGVRYDIYHKENENRAHEFIINTAKFKEYGISEIDISKRLLDYGFHSPTNSWPILKSLMIEITESESDIEIERFIEAMLQIHSEIITNPELLLNAPHTQYDIINWKYNYSIMDGCYPFGEKQVDTKFWPTINRVNNIFGDNKLLGRK